MVAFPTRKRGQDPPYLITTSSVVPKGSFSAPTFDTFLVEQQPEVADKKQDGGGLSKKFRSFPWTSSNKKQPPPALAMYPEISQLAPPLASPGLSVPSSPTSIHSPTSPESPGNDSIRHSTLAAFPVPPVIPSSSAPKPHATAFITPHVAVSASASASTVSTFKSSSSFASSNLFNNTDEWESGSEATSMSIASSPESSSRDSSGETKQQRMWRVKGLNADSPSKRGQYEGGLKVVEEEDETESRRNSTPVPRMVALMLADPETPPRPKRFSASSTKPSPTSPPFDLEHERMLRAARDSNPSTPGSPESSRDADDEDDSPTQGKIAARLFGFGDSLNAALGPKTRIPSIRFEGISMDAVFAQVEKNMKGSPQSVREQKAARRRTRVLSLYQPAAFGGEQGAQKAESIEEEPTSIDSNTISPSPSELDALRCASTTPYALRPMDIARPRPYPRRTSSRPAPLDVEAANAFPTLASLSSSASLVSVTSPSLRGAYSPAPNRAAPVDLFSPTSPTHTLAPSPVLPSPRTPIAESATPRLAGPFVPAPPPPATPTTPIRASPIIPEVCIFPPTLDDEDCDWQAPIDQNSQPGATKVVVVPQKRMVRASTRAAPKKAGERKPIVTRPLTDNKENYTPPPSPAFSTTSTIHYTPSRDPTIDARRLSSNSPLTIRRHSSDVDSDVEETLQHLLNRLNRPHTPPTPGRGHLTASALEQHARQSALGVPTFDGPSITVTDTDLEHEEEMEREKERFERESSESAGWESASTSASERVESSERTSTINGSRYSDAPLSITIPKIRLSPSPSAAEVRLPLSPVVDSTPAFDTPISEEEDPVEAEINAALASLQESSSSDSLPSSRSASSFASSQDGPDRSSIAYFANTDSPEQRSRVGTLPRSRTTSSDLASILSSATTDSSLTDGDEDSLYTAELAVVQTVQRVSCSYDVRAIGLAR